MDTSEQNQTCRNTEKTCCDCCWFGRFLYPIQGCDSIREQTVGECGIATERCCLEEERQQLGDQLSNSSSTSAVVNLSTTTTSDELQSATSQSGGVVSSTTASESSDIISSTTVETAGKTIGESTMTMADDIPAHTSSSYSVAESESQLTSRQMLTQSFRRDPSSMIVMSTDNGDSVTSQAITYSSINVEGTRTITASIPISLSETISPVQSTKSYSSSVSSSAQRNIRTDSGTTTEINTHSTTTQHYASVSPSQSESYIAVSQSTPLQSIVDTSFSNELIITKQALSSRTTDRSITVPGIDADTSVVIITETTVPIKTVSTQPTVIIETETDSSTPSILTVKVTPTQSYSSTVLENNIITDSYTTENVIRETISEKITTSSAVTSTNSLISVCGTPTTGK